MVRLRNDERGYGLVTKSLHWLTVLALVGQFTVGYAMVRFDDLGEAIADQWLGGEQDRLLALHAVLGVSILVLAAVRVTWRTFTPLPPWAEGLSATERRIAHRTEQALYWLLFLIPLTGLGLVFLTGEDWEIGGREWGSPVDLADDDTLLTAHVTTHLVFFVVLAVHVGLVLKHQLVDRDRLLNRML
jgi:cytochrome b561